jgi:anti-sigma factor RsiW
MTENQEQLKLQAYLDGELPEAQAKEVAARVARDPAASALLAELGRTNKALADYETEIRLPESREFYWSKIQREIERQDSAGSQRTTGVSWIALLRRALVPVSGLALVAIIALVATRDTQQHSSPTETTLADSGAMIYHDYAAGATFVWLSYPAEKEIALSDEIGTFE